METEQTRMASSMCGACGRGAYEVEGVRYCVGCGRPTSGCPCPASV